MATPRVRLGDLLVEAQIITREQLEEVLALQRSDGRRLGTLLVEGGLVSETQVTQILSQQLSVPWVSLYHIDFSRQLLNLVPRDIAERFCLVPIFVRRVRGLGDALYVAMDDPSDEVAQREVAQFSGLHVRAMIAPPSDIRSAIRAYYGGGSTSASLSEAVAESQAFVEPSLEPSQRPRRDVLAPPASVRPPAPLAGGATVEVLRAPSARAPAATLPLTTQVAEALAASSEPAVPAVGRAATLHLGTEPAVAAAAEVAEPRQALPSSFDVELEPETEVAPAAAAPPAAVAAPAVAPEDAAAPPPSLGEPREGEESSPSSAGSQSLREGAFGAAARSRLQSAEAQSSSEPALPAPAAEIPAPAGGGQRMVTLTLLDGTQVTLPAKGRRAARATPSDEPRVESSELTARDLVSALRAVAHGADATEILGENVRWEALFSALLSLLLRKHLIADWEFVEEYKKV